MVPPLVRGPWRGAGIDIYNEGHLNRPGPPRHIGNGGEGNHGRNRGERGPDQTGASYSGQGFRHLFPYIVVKVHFTRKLQQDLIQIGLSAAKCLYKLVSAPTLNYGLSRRFQCNGGAYQIDNACTFHLLG